MSGVIFQQIVIEPKDEKEAILDFYWDYPSGLFYNFLVF
jgi:hypothetical protein